MRYFVDSPWDFEYMDKQLGRLRQWLQGFQQGGGHLPIDFDVLRQCQVALCAAKPAKTPDDLRDALRELSTAVDFLDDALTHVRAKLAQVAASGMEAPSGGETVQLGSTEGDSPTAESRDAQKDQSHDQ